MSLTLSYLRLFIYYHGRISLIWHTWDQTRGGLSNILDYQTVHVVTCVGTGMSDIFLSL